MAIIGLCFAVKIFSSAALSSDVQKTDPQSPPSRQREVNRRMEERKVSILYSMLSSSLNMADNKLKSP